MTEQDEKSKGSVLGGLADIFGAFPNAVARIKQGRGISGKIITVVIAAMISVVGVVVSSIFVHTWAVIVGLIAIGFLVVYAVERIIHVIQKHPLESVEGIELVQLEQTRLAYKHGTPPEHTLLQTNISVRTLGSSGPAALLTSENVQEPDEPESDQAHVPDETLTDIVGTETEGSE